MYLLSGRKDFIDFDSYTENPPWKEGRVFWDKTNHSLAVYDDQSDTTLQVGQEIRVRVFNDNGFTILNGQAVSATNVTAEGITMIELAIASNSDLSQTTIGVASHDIEGGTYGWATLIGFINNIDTSSYTEGAVIWLSESVAGAYQETRPSSPSYQVRMGIVTISDASVGKIYIKVDMTEDALEFFTPPWSVDSGNGYIYPEDLTHKVGIGTDTPDEILDIEADGAILIISDTDQTHSDTNMDQSYLILKGQYDAGEDDLSLSQARIRLIKGVDDGIPGSDMAFDVMNEAGTGLIERMRIAMNGNVTMNGKVGIGTNDPQTEVDVVGDVSVSDAFYLGDKDTDGTWRIIKKGNDLSFERRESSIWVAKETMLA